MASVNKVFLIGNLGMDPDLRYTGSGQAVCNFRLATTDVWKDKSGERQERTEWHRIVVWGDQAAAVHSCLSKGRPAHIEGRLQTRQWTDKEGNERFTTEIVADRVTFLGGKEDSDGGGRRGGGSSSAPAKGKSAEQKKSSGAGSGAGSSTNTNGGDGWGAPLDDDSDVPF